MWHYKSDRTYCAVAAVETEKGLQQQIIETLGGTTERKGSTQESLGAKGRAQQWDDPGRLDKIGRHGQGKLL